MSPSIAWLYEMNAEYRRIVGNVAHRDRSPSRMHYVRTAMTGDATRDDLRSALEDGNAARLDAAVNDLLRETARSGDATAALKATVDLMAARRFDTMLRLADGAARVAPPSQAWQLWPHVVQALIELGATNTAERVITQLLTHDEPEAIAAKGHLYARLGRMRKDHFVDTGLADALTGAIAAYSDASRHGADELWAGVNAVALAATANRRGLAIDGTTIPDADRLLALATTAPLPRSAWSIATELELRLARGEAATLQPLLAQLFEAHDASPFVYVSLSRQLTEIWELDAGDPLLVMLGERSLAVGAGEVLLPATPDGYERTFGTEFPIPVEVYRSGLDRARSVGNLLMNGAFSVGTVFAMRGDDLHPSLAGRTVLVTNEHVVPDPARENRIQASELLAQFDGVAGPDGKALMLGNLRAIWRSPREQLDVTVLVSDDAAVEQLSGLDVAPVLPVVRDGAYVYVIGHPGGGGLQLSIRGNDLIDQDGTRIHYRAPTSKGSSGSPVFDDVWRLIGVHHKGSTDLPALNGATGTYPANEGNSIHALRAALETTPPQGWGEPVRPV